MASNLVVGNHVVVVDDEDVDFCQSLNLEIVNKTRHKKKKLYAVHRVRYNGKTARFSLHRLLMKVVDKNVLVDHRNGDSLDCRKSNLRIATHQQNVASAAPAAGKTSKYKGVHFSTRLGKWVACISFNRNRQYLGSFSSELEAAKAYQEQAKKYHGEYAWIGEL